MLFYSFRLYFYYKHLLGFLKYFLNFNLDTEFILLLAAPIMLAYSYFRYVFSGIEHTEVRSEEHTSELQSRGHLVCRLLLEKKKYNKKKTMLCHIRIILF